MGLLPFPAGLRKLGKQQLGEDDAEYAPGSQTPVLQQGSCTLDHPAGEMPEQGTRWLCPWGAVPTFVLVSVPAEQREQGSAAQGAELQQVTAEAVAQRGHRTGCILHGSRQGQI